MLHHVLVWGSSQRTPIYLALYDGIHDKAEFTFEYSRDKFGFFCYVISPFYWFDKPGCRDPPSTI